jgi:hypothetical protein
VKAASAAHVLAHETSDPAAENLRLRAGSVPEARRNGEKEDGAAVNRRASDLIVERPIEA